jgi:hypothetical protein
MEIDEKLIRKLNRQMRSIRLMLGFFTLVTLAVLGIWIYMAYKFVTFTHDVNNKITTIQNTTTQKLDIKSQLCADTTSLLAKEFCND